MKYADPKIQKGSRYASQLMDGKPLKYNEGGIKNMAPATRYFGSFAATPITDNINDAMIKGQPKMI